MAHCYAHLFEIPTTAFRFFTVYGPWGRPDMAYFLFVRKILNGEPIEIFDDGESFRDFTFVDDLVESIVRLVDARPSPPGERPGSVAPIDPISPVAAYRLVNIGGGQPVKLVDFVGGDRKGARPQGQKDHEASPTRRCCRNLCLCRFAGIPHRLQTKHATFSRHTGLCRLVPSAHELGVKDEAALVASSLTAGPRHGGSL